MVKVKQSLLDSYFIPKRRVSILPPLFIMQLYRVQYFHMACPQSAYSESLTNFKIVMVGQRFVGKTSLITRYVQVTVGIEFSSKVVAQGEENYVLQLWDTAGQECFRSLVRSFYKKACCVVIAYCDPAQMMHSINSYLQQIEENTSSETLIFVVRTKLDLLRLTQQEVIFLQNLVSNKTIVNWMALSSKDGVNINQFFQMISDQLIPKYNQNREFRKLVDAKRLSGSIYLSAQSTRESSKAKAGRQRCCN